MFNGEATYCLRIHTFFSLLVVSLMNYSVRLVTSCYYSIYIIPRRGINKCGTFCHCPNICRKQLEQVMTVWFVHHEHLNRKYIPNVAFVHFSAEVEIILLLQDNFDEIHFIFGKHYFSFRLVRIEQRLTADRKERKKNKYDNLSTD